MANYVRCVVEMDGIKNLPLFNEDGEFDFNKVVPMPESLKIESGSRSDRGLKNVTEYVEDRDSGRLDDPEVNQKWKDIIDADPEEWQIGVTAYFNNKRFGYPTWYEWCIDNWGTKWNAMETRIESDDTISFQTAWNAPMPVMRRLSEMYPKTEIAIVYADECDDGNSGLSAFFEGRSAHTSPKNLKEAQALYDFCWGVKPED